MLPTGEAGSYSYVGEKFSVLRVGGRGGEGATHARYVHRSGDAPVLYRTLSPTQGCGRSETRYAQLRNCGHDFYYVPMFLITVM